MRCRPSGAQCDHSLHRYVVTPTDHLTNHRVQDLPAVYRDVAPGCVPHAPSTPLPPWLALWVDAQLQGACEGGLRGAGALATLADWDDHLAGPQEVAVALGRHCVSVPKADTPTAALRAHQEAMARQAMAAVQAHSATLGMAPRGDVQLQAAFAARMAAVDVVRRAQEGSPGSRPRRGARAPPPRYLVDQVLYLDEAEELLLRGLSVFGT